MSNILPANVVVLYANGNADSYAFAKAYQSLHDLDDAQLLAVPCSSNEILSSHAQFVTEIESTVISYLASTPFSIMGIVVGHGVPGGFHDGVDIIATTSRLAMVNSSYSKKTPNSLFDRKVYSAYTQDDAATVLIASRMDFPSLDIALSFIESARRFKRQQTANGRFFFDPNTVLNTSDESEYAQQLQSFGTHLLPILSLKMFTTTFWDEYTDVVIPKLKQDSFMWAWKSDRAGYTFFQDSSTARVFLYNADKDGGASLRDTAEKRFPWLALQAGYVATAGAASDPSVIAHLRPTPFFSALMQGAVIGEAFTFACPFLNWTVALFGDPLLKVDFPTTATLSLGQSFFAGWENMHDHLASSIAYMLRRENELQLAATDANNITEDVKTSVFPQIYAAYVRQKSTWAKSILPLIKSFLRFSTDGDTSPFAFDKFLFTNSAKVSRLFQLVLKNYVAADTNMYAEGFWKLESDIVSPLPLFLRYHFLIDISLESNFATISQSYSSASSQTNWTYEKESNAFEAVLSTGVPSSYAGRRVRFESPASGHMARGTVYYYRIRQRDDLGNYTSYVTAKAIVNT